MRTAGLIVAAGRGLRLGDERPSNTARSGRRPCSATSLAALLRRPDIGRCWSSSTPTTTPLYDAAVAGIDDPPPRPPVAGGATRAASVRAGLEALAADPPDRVLIHDAARPFVSRRRDRARCSPPSTRRPRPSPPCRSSMRSGARGRRARRRRSTAPSLWRAQTPQGFRFDAILAAHRATPSDAADDVEVARAAGLAVRLVPGDEVELQDHHRRRPRQGAAADRRTRWTSGPATASTSTPSAPATT